MCKKVLKVLDNDRGSSYVDSVIKLIIAMVLAGILLFGFFAILKSDILPGVQNHIDKNVNGGQAQAMTDMDKQYTKWKNALLEEISGNKEDFETSEEIILVYALHQGMITADDFQLDGDVLAAKLPEKAIIPENDPEIVIYWYFSAINYIDGVDTTLMTREQFSEYERTDEGKSSIMGVVGG